MFYTYSSMPRPTAMLISSEEWKNTAGSKRWWLEGNSNVQNMNVVEAIGLNAWNIGQGGDVPQGCIDQFNNELKPKIDAGLLNRPEKVYIQIGANYYRTMPCAEFYWGTYTSLLAQMSELIDLYKGVVDNPQDIVIASMPYVQPDMTVLDIPGWMTAGADWFENYTRYCWAGAIAAFPWNNYLCAASIALQTLCQQKGVQFLNIFGPLKVIWDTNYSSWLWWATQKRWWDYVHCDSITHMVIGNLIKQAWGV